MYFTIFDKGESDEMMIIHKQEAKPYAEDLAQYPDYFQVTQKPTAEEAEIIFRICKPGSLCAGIKMATTVKLEK